MDFYNDLCNFVNTSWGKSCHFALKLVILVNGKEIHGGPIVVVS